MDANANRLRVLVLLENAAKSQGAARHGWLVYAAQWMCRGMAKLLRVSAQGAVKSGGEASMKAFQVVFLGERSGSQSVTLYGNSEEQVRGWIQNIMGEFCPLDFAVMPVLDVRLAAFTGKEVSKWY